MPWQKTLQRFKNATPVALVRDTVTAWSDDKAARLGAALAYYSLFSLGPLLIVAIAVAGIFYGKEAASGELYHQISGALGDNGAKAVEGIVAGAEKPSATTVAGIVSIITLLFGASGVVIQLKDALNAVWGVKRKPGLGIKAFLKDYVISLAAVLGLGFILLASLVLSAVLAGVGKYATQWLPLPELALQSLNFLLSFGLITLIFALMYKVLPDAEIRWRDVWIGALGTSFLFGIGKTLVALYLGKQSYDTTYGAAASVVIVLVWVYFLAQIVFFGAEFTKVYANRFGSHIKPSDMAVGILPEQRAAQGMSVKVKEGRSKRFEAAFNPS